MCIPHLTFHHIHERKYDAANISTHCLLEQWEENFPHQTKEQLRGVMCFSSYDFMQVLYNEPWVLPEDHHCCPRWWSDWQSLTEACGVNYKTAYTWISQKDKPLPKGGKKKKLSEDQVNALCDEVEKDPALTLVQQADFSQWHFGIALSASTVHTIL